MNKKFNLILIGQLPTESILDISISLFILLEQGGHPNYLNKKPIIARLFDAIFDNVCF